MSVLVVIFSEQGEFLLMQRADKREYWQSVTGSLDAVDEAPFAAALRELFEETGIRAEPDPQPFTALAQLSRKDLCTPFVLRAWPKTVQYEIFEHWRHRYAPGVVNNTEHWFHVCVPRYYTPVLSPREHVDFAWLDSQEACARCFSPNNAQAIECMANRLIS